MKKPLLASEIYATSQAATCSGEDECHWCSASCKRGLFFHDDDPPIPFHKSTSGARRPGNAYMCCGCWLYRRKRICVKTLTGTAMIDGQSPFDHSWFVTTKEAVVIRKEDHEELLNILVDPPAKFFLSLISESKLKNQLHLSVANELENYQAEDAIHYTLNNQPMSYTIYELTEAMKKGPEGTEPGVQMLFRTLYNRTSELVADNAILKQTLKRGRGRPTKEANEPKSVVQSG